ncbi:MAG: FAD-binding oxidoreductase [Proteobacteria bacterium]|nr:FAD-binding oxidoreductase [Pseudomonadota bacterium]
MTTSFDVAVIGGGVMGLSTAFHLLEREPGLKVAVVERDPTYARASTPRSAGGVRLQFSLPENVAMSAYGLAFYKTFGETMAVAGERPEIGLKQWGYLFLLPEGAREAAHAMNAMQAAGGARNELLDPDALARRFPSLNLDGIALGSFGPEDGWTDPYAILMGFRRKVQAMGASLITDEVLGIGCDASGARSLALAGGTTLFADSFVCAAGAWSRDLLASAGVTVPVAPVRRMVFYFDIRDTLERLPLTISPDGHYFRPEGAGYIGGRSIEDEPEGENLEVDYGYFEEVLWPMLAQRCPAFETLRLKNAWAGLYDINRLDENMLAGPHPDGPENLHVLCGFSGHGLQQAPAAGRAIAELILDRRFVSIDLERLSCRRLVTGQAMAEAGIV